MSKQEEMRAPTISEELLKKAGYIEYEGAGQFGDRFFQKKFTDRHGTKYFIEVAYSFFAQNGVQSRFWDFWIQLDTEKGSVRFETIQWFNQDGIYSGRTIAEVEAYFQWLWIRHGKPYYESK
jgi:hypothetical protein